MPNQFDSTSHHLQKEATTSFRPSKTIHTTKKHRKNEGRPSSQKAHNVQTVRKFERTRQAISTQKSSSLTFFFSFILSPHPSPLLSQHVHGGRKAFLAVTKGLLAATAQLPGLVLFLTQQAQDDVAEPPLQAPNLARKGRSCR